jgi:hypothetical protein
VILAPLQRRGPHIDGARLRKPVVAFPHPAATAHSGLHQSASPRESDAPAERSTHPPPRIAYPANSLSRTKLMARPINPVINGKGRVGNRLPAAPMAELRAGLLTRPVSLRSTLPRELRSVSQGSRHPASRQRQRPQRIRRSSASCRIRISTETQSVIAGPHLLSRGRNSDVSRWHILSEQMPMNCARLRLNAETTTIFVHDGLVDN